MAVAAQARVSASCAASPVSPLNTAAATVSADFCSALLVAGLGPAAASEVVMSSLSSVSSVSWVSWVSSVSWVSWVSWALVSLAAGVCRLRPVPPPRTCPLMRVPLLPLLVSVANTACTLHCHRPAPASRAADNRFQEMDNLT